MACTLYKGLKQPLKIELTKGHGSALHIPQNKIMYSSSYNTVFFFAAINYNPGTHIEYELF